MYKTFVFGLIFSLCGCIVKNTSERTAQMNEQGKVKGYFHPPTIEEIDRAECYFNKDNKTSSISAENIRMILECLRENKTYAARDPKTLEMVAFEFYLSFYLKNKTVYVVSFKFERAVFYAIQNTPKGQNFLGYFSIDPQLGDQIFRNCL